MVSVETGSLGTRAGSLLYSDWLDSKSHGSFCSHVPHSHQKKIRFLCGCWNMSLGLNAYVADLFEMYTCIYMS